MYKYILALKPVVLAGGIEGLEPTKRKLFENIIQILAEGFKASNEIEDAVVRSDYTIHITATTDVYDILKKNIGDNAIVTVEK